MEALLFQTVSVAATPFSHIQANYRVAMPLSAVAHIAIGAFPITRVGLEVVSMHESCGRAHSHVVRFPPLENMSSCRYVYAAYCTATI